MLKREYLKRLGIACLIPLVIPMIAKVILYFSLLSLITANFIQIGVKLIQHRFNLNIPAIVGEVLSMMFWPIIGTFLLDLIYRFGLRKPFQQHMICAILLWLLFNSGSFLVR